MDAWAEITRTGGRKTRKELYYGSGYLGHRHVVSGCLPMLQRSEFTIPPAKYGKQPSGKFPAGPSEEPLIEDAVIANSLLDRLVRGAPRLEMQEESVEKNY